MTGTSSRDWNLVPDEERLSLVFNAFVPRGITNDYITDVARVRRNARLGQPAGCLVVTGPPGVGKSTFLQQYVAQHPPTIGLDGRGEEIATRRPVLNVEIPSDTTVIGAAQEFVTRLMSARYAKGSRGVLDGMIKDQLKRQQVELVIADEFQNVQEKAFRGKSGESRVADWLKMIMKVTNVPFVLAGLPETMNIIKANDQLATLAGKERKISAYTWEGDGKKSWKAFLGALDKAMPFNQVARLVDHAENLYLVTQGNLRTLSFIVHDAASRAIEAGRQGISLEDLAYGYDLRPESPLIGRNPFDVDGLFRKRS